MSRKQVVTDEGKARVQETLSLAKVARRASSSSSSTAPTWSQRKSSNGTSEGDREEMLDVHTLEEEEARVEVAESP